MVAGKLLCDSCKRKRRRPQFGRNQAGLFRMMIVAYVCVVFKLHDEFENKVTHPSRSMSVQQESAQYLAGEDLPREVFSALLQKTEISDAVIGVINLSPYDCHLEQCAMSSFKRTNGDIKMASLSVSKDLRAVQYCQRSIALKLLQDPLLEYNPPSCAML